MTIARTLMVQGMASDVGKSVLVTALCRLYARRGVKVAPFKAQNMALNSTVTIDGAEIGRAQYAQAEAAGVTATADMNPILLKPESTSRSQVVVLGRPIGSVNFGDYIHRTDALRTVVGDALDRLRRKYELVVIEGAGSPAEVNLKQGDLVNMWVAKRADAPVVLVTDIERGGAIAAVVGTLELLEPWERARVQAIVVNKFRGDRKLFVEGVRFLEKKCGIPVAGVVPHMGDTGIASEDSLNLRTENLGGPVVVAVVRLPHVSNFDEFEPLARERGVTVRWCDRPDQLAGATLVVLPGSKSTMADLAWLRQSGLAAAIIHRAEAAQPILGICGGYQMLGARLQDPLGVESRIPDAPGLGLLPVVTRFDRDKITTRVRLRLAEGVPLLAEAGGAEVEGYEIHHGRVTPLEAVSPLGIVQRRGNAATNEPEGALARGRPVAGTLVHGLFESAAVRRALIDATRVPQESAPDPYSAVASHFAAALDMDLIDRIIGL